MESYGEPICQLELKFGFADTKVHEAGRCMSQSRFLLSFIAGDIQQ